MGRGKDGVCAKVLQSVLVTEPRIPYGNGEGLSGCSAGRGRRGGAQQPLPGAPAQQSAAPLRPRRPGRAAPEPSCSRGAEKPQRGAALA